MSIGMSCRKSRKRHRSKIKRKRPKTKVAIVGSGPAGLSCAHHLGRMGYQTTIFEALPVAGGMMRVGIPAYRLPRDVLQREIDDILSLGVELKLKHTDPGYQQTL